MLIAIVRVRIISWQTVQGALAKMLIDIVRNSWQPVLTDAQACDAYCRGIDYRNWEGALLRTRNSHPLTSVQDGPSVMRGSLQHSKRSDQETPPPLASLPPNVVPWGE